MANGLGLRNIAFDVDDLQAAVDRLAPDGHGLVGAIGQYEPLWLMAHVRDPEGILQLLLHDVRQPCNKRSDLGHGLEPLIPVGQTEARAAPWSATKVSDPDA
jgi:hypothetical protein